jgi:hypothetical protein
MSGDTNLRDFFVNYEHGQKRALFVMINLGEALKRDWDVEPTPE